MANISRNITLNNLTRRILAKEGKNNDDHFRYNQIICDALRHMHMHDFSVYVTKVVTVDTDTNTFSYPGDYVRYLAIATPIDGRWWVFTRDNGMVPLEDDDSTTIQDSLPNISNYEFYSSLGKAGGWNKYYFREDKANSRFQIGGYTPDLVVLKYVTNGIDAAGNINIPDYATYAIEDYVRWKIADYDREAQSEIARLWAQYRDSRRQMRQVFRPTLMEIRDTVYSSSGSLQR